MLKWAKFLCVHAMTISHFTSQILYHFIHHTTPWVKKGCHPNHGCNFVNSWSICKILSLLQTAVNFQQNQY